MARRRNGAGASVNMGANGASARRTGLKIGEIRIPAGSKKSMLVQLSLELWRRGRLDLKQLVHARTKGRIRTQTEALRVLNRASVADLEPLVLEGLDGDRVVVEGTVYENRERAFLERLGAEFHDGQAVPSDSEEGEKPGLRFVDMTPALLGLAAVVMALRYLALGMSDRELYVMAGIGYATFMLIRTFSYKLRRPKNAPPPELEPDGR